MLLRQRLVSLFGELVLKRANPLFPPSGLTSFQDANALLRPAAGCISRPRKTAACCVVRSHSDGSLEIFERLGQIIPAVVANARD